MYLDMEEFLHTLFYHHFLENPADKDVIVLDRLIYPRKMIGTLSKLLFERFEISNVYYFLSEVMPMYCIGIDTGIVIDSGFLYTNILPISYSRPLTDAMESVPVGSINVELRVKQLLIEDNLREDASVDFASVQEEWASRTEEDPYWWTREENNSNEIKQTESGSEDGATTNDHNGDNPVPKSME